jgi:hypothetical protein
MLSLQMRFRITLQPSQKTNIKHPETQEFLYAVTFNKKVSLVQYPTLEFQADDLEHAKSLLDPSEYIEIRPAQ